MLAHTEKLYYKVNLVMGCECSNSSEGVRYVRPTSFQPMTSEKVVLQPTKSVPVRTTIKTEAKTELQYEPMEHSTYSFRNIDELIQQIERDFEKQHLRKQAREKCRLVLYLLQQERRAIRSEQLSTAPRRRRMEEAMAALNAPLMAEIKATNKAMSDIYKVTFDALSILMQLPLRAVNVVPLYVSQRLVVRFWQDSFAESGQSLVNAFYDLRTELTKLVEGNRINGETLELLEPLVRTEWFCEEVAARVSKAIGLIVSWVRNLWDLTRTNRVILRKRRRVGRIERWVADWMRRNAKDIYAESGLQ